MKDFILKTPMKNFLSLLLIFLLYFQVGGFGLRPRDTEVNQEQEIKKAKLYKDIFPLISEVDLYCSFFMLEEKKPEMKIIGSEREKESILLRENDIFYINKGKKDGLEEGQIFLIIEIGSKIKNPFIREKFGHLALKRGRAQIISLEESWASARLEKVCGPVMVGNFLLPFEEKASLLGKDLGYDVSPEGKGLEGVIVYLLRDYEQVARDHWAIIDLGERNGLQFGQQLIVYRKSKDGAIQNVGNLIVVDTQKRTSTVKIISCNDALRVGDRVRAHF